MHRFLKFKSSALALFAFVITISNISCKTLYIHPNLTKNHTSFATLDDPYFGVERSPIFIIIETIDGRPRGVGAFKEYHLPEGQHTIKITKPSTRGEKMTVLTAEHPIEMTFSAIAGHHYKIMIVFDEPNKRWAGFIVDKQLDKIVSTMREIKE